MSDHPLKELILQYVYAVDAVCAVEYKLQALSSWGIALDDDQLTALASPALRKMFSTDIQQLYDKAALLIGKISETSKQNYQLVMDEYIRNVIHGIKAAGNGDLDAFRDAVNQDRLGKVRSDVRAQVFTWITGSILN